MKVKITPNPEFDFTIMHMGGFDDTPTKQDKFKPLKFNNPVDRRKDGSEVPIEEELYTLNKKQKENQRKFEEWLKGFVQEHVDESHPYKKPLKLEAMVSVTMSSKRRKKVDLDNLVKAILDCLNGIVFEDDSQIVSLLASKNVIEDDFVPELSGIGIGIRILGEGKPPLNSIPLYHMEYVDE